VTETFTPAEQIAEPRREIALRKRVYPTSADVYEREDAP
jgi:hypothetical protein